MRRCAGAILVREGKLLLAKRTAQRQLYPNRWDVIGGDVEAGETVEQALLREVEEEIGVVPTRFAALAPIAEPDPATNGAAVYHIFVVDEWHGGEPTMCGDEHSALGWFTADKACALPGLALAEYRAVFRAVVSR